MKIVRHPKEVEISFCIGEEQVKYLAECINDRIEFLEKSKSGNNDVKIKNKLKILKSWRKKIQ